MKELVSLESELSFTKDYFAIQKLRFIVTSPPNTGVLIDDIRIAPLQPQRIVGIEVVPATLPALVGADTCRLVHLKVTTAGEKDPQ